MMHICKRERAAQVGLFFGLLLAAGDAFAQGSQLPEVDFPRSSSAPARTEPAPVADEQAAVTAPPQIPRLHWYYRAGAAARVNPLGLFVSGTVQLRYRLYDSDKLAFKDNYVAIGPVGFFSPAFMRGGIGVEMQPLSVLQLSASYEAIGFFKTFQFNQSFASATSNSGDAELNRLRDLGLNYRSLGGVFTAAALLQVKFGPIAARSNFRAFYYHHALRDGDRVWYDSILDILSPNNGWVVTNDADVLYMTKFGFNAGVRYTLTAPLFGPQHFAPGEALSDPNGPTHRIGPMFTYTFFDREGERFNAPTLALLVQWWVKHRYRAGQEISQAFPWIALAFQFRGII